MAFVVSDGKLMGLERASAPRSSSISLAADFSADYATIWKTQPHVRTVIGFLARNIAQIGLHAFERTSDTDRRRLTDHPLADLIAKPNPRTTRYRLIDALVNDLGIYDVACWAKMKSADQPVGLLRLPPKQIEPIGDSWGWPDAIRFKGNKGSIDLPMDQVVFFRGYNPDDSRWGVSPMETLRRVLAEEYQATLYREQLWRNGARFPGYIKRPKAAGQWSPEARERFRADWRGLYTGNGPGAGGTPVLEDDMEFSAGGITPAQAQYLETRKLTREEVAAAFHIPLPMVGILDHATFSNIKEQHQNLYQDTLGPWLEMIQQEIGLQLLPDFDDSTNIYVEFNLADKMKGSFEEQATSLQTAVGAPWLTRNEARARQNLPQVDGGDDLVTPLNVLVGGQASPTDSAPKAGGAVREKSSEAVRNVRLMKARATEQHSKKLSELLSKFFERQGKAVLSAIGAGDNWWDAERWDKELSGDLHAASVSMAATLGKAQAEALGYTSADYDVDQTVAFLKAVADRYATSINTTTKGKLDALDDDAEPVQVFDEATTSRAVGAGALIATFMAGFATHEAAEQIAYRNDVTPTKTWVTGPNPRAEHAAMDGETVSLDDNFSDGSKWPGSGGDAPGCNCSVDINI